MLIAAVALAGGGCERKPAPPLVGMLAEGAARPNVILIVIDTLRADRLGAYGGRAGLSPNLDAFAAEGVTFDWAIAPSSWTMPSMASIFTGLYPTVHKATRFQKPTELKDPNFKLRGLPRALTTLAETFEAGGYQTAGVTANPFMLREYGYGQGFVYYDAEDVGNTADGRGVTASAMKWLSGREANRPFFLYLHYMDTHGPYDAPAEYLEPLLAAVEANPKRTRLEEFEYDSLDYLDTPPPAPIEPLRHARMRMYREYWEARYNAGVRQMDDYFGELIAQLRAAGVWDDAYVILTSDHGEALCEHGWWDHGYSVRTPEVRVPLVLRWPGVLPPRRIPHVTSLVHLMPTLIHQLRLPGVAGMQGTSIAALLDGSPPARPAEAFVEYIRVGGQQKGLYRGDWKLMYFTVGPTPHELFDMRSDPSELQNVAAANPKIAGELHAAVADWIKQNEARAREVEEELVNVINAGKLGSVGYTGGDTRSGATQPARGPGSPATSAPAANHP